MATKQMSLRKMAKVLGITPAYLSMLVNGKRRWQPDLYERYCELVNSVNREGQPDVAHTDSYAEATQPITSVAGARGSRTHRTGRRAGAIGFEALEGP